MKGLRELNAAIDDFSDVHSINLDVENMYPSISHEFGLRNVMKELLEMGMEPDEVDMVIAGCKLMLKNCYAKFDGDIYHVDDGGSMGPRFMPGYTDIAMVRFDKL